MSDPMVGEGPGDLVSVVWSDQGDGIATLNGNAVEAAGFTTEEVLVAAEQNFVEVLNEAFCAGMSEDGVVSVGLHRHPWLGTSLMFVPSLLTKVMAEHGWTRALLAAPTRETIDLVDADAPDAHSVMERWMTKALAGPRTQSEVVFSFSQSDTEYRKTHLMIDHQLVRLN